jgi:hypothetical protein
MYSPAAETTIEFCADTRHIDPSLSDEVHSFAVDGMRILRIVAATLVANAANAACQIRQPASVSQGTIMRAVADDSVGVIRGAIHDEKGAPVVGLVRIDEHASLSSDVSLRGQRGPLRSTSGARLTAIVYESGSAF